MGTPHRDALLAYLGMPASGRSDRRAFVLIPLAALVAVFPLIVKGCSCGHDFDFHLLSWLEAARQFGQGTLRPHWAFTPAYNAGEPRFVFYPPLSWMLGSLLELLLAHLSRVTEVQAWAAAPILYTWVALTAAGLTMHRLAREFTSRNAALIAAMVYLANPYMLFTGYERTAYAELLATAWMPLLLLSILRERVTVRGVALPVALLWLTNAPAAVMGCYTLAFLAVWRLISDYRGHRDEKATGLLALKTLAGTVLGFGLVAFYLVPAAYEQRYVQIAMAQVDGMRIMDNFLFHRTGTSNDQVWHDVVLRTVSLIAVTLLVVTAAVLEGTYQDQKRSKVALAARGAGAIAFTEDHAELPVKGLIALTLGIGFLMTPPSAVVWRVLPEAAFLQFPWRLLAVLGAVMAVTIGGAMAGSRMRVARAVVTGLVVCGLMAFWADRFYRQRCYPEDSAPARVALFYSNEGSEPTDEYTPTLADNDAIGHTDPPYWLASSAIAAPPMASPTNPPGMSPLHVTVTAPRAEFLVMNLRRYPGWRVTLNGSEARATEAAADRDDGLMAMAIPAGVSTVDVAWRRMPDETVGEEISGAAVMGWLGLWGWTRRRSVGRA